MCTHTDTRTHTRTHAHTHTCTHTPHTQARKTIPSGTLHSIMHVYYMHYLSLVLFADNAYLFWSKTLSFDSNVLDDVVRLQIWFRTGTIICIWVYNFTNGVYTNIICIWVYNFTSDVYTGVACYESHGTHVDFSICLWLPEAGICYGPDSEGWTLSLDQSPSNKITSIHYSTPWV